MFTYGIFIVLLLTFKSTICLDMIIMYGVKQRSRSIFSRWISNRLNNSYWKDHPLSYCSTILEYYSANFVVIQVTVLMWLFLDSLLCFILSCLLPIPHCLNYFSSVIIFKSNSIGAPTLFFFFKITLVILCTFHFQINIRISLSNCRKKKKS